MIRLGIAASLALLAMTWGGVGYAVLCGLLVVFLLGVAGWMIAVGLEELLDPCE